MRKHWVLITSAVLLGSGLVAMPAWADARDFLAIDFPIHARLQGDTDKTPLRGYRIQGSKGLGPYGMVRAGANMYRFREASFYSDAESSQVGVGAGYPWQQGGMNFLFWGTLNYEIISLGVVGTGYGLDMGVLVQPMPAFDVSLTAKPYSKLRIQHRDTRYEGIELSAAYNVTPQLALTLSSSRYRLSIDHASGDEKLRYHVNAGLGIRFRY